MIIVTVELLSAVTGEQKTLAQMDICNTGEGTHRKGNYIAVTHRGRDAISLARRTPQRSCEVKDWPRLDKHVWNLVQTALTGMGYGR